MNFAERAQRIAAMFRQGLTMEVIGGHFGITRERVRQILTKQGVRAEDGGRSLVTDFKRQASKQKKDERRKAKFMAEYGVIPDDVPGVSAAVREAYKSQKNSAGNRGIEWRLNLGQWLSVWAASGKLDQRGRGKGHYCMSRISDAGAYELGNVHIQLFEENGREAVERWRGKKKKHPGVFLLYPGLPKPYRAAVGRTTVGFFATEEEAAKARKQFIAEHKPNHLGRGMLGMGRGWTLKKGRHSNPYQVQVAGTKTTCHATEEEARQEYLRRCEEVASAKRQPQEAA